GGVFPVRCGPPYADWVARCTPPGAVLVECTPLCTGLLVHHAPTFFNQPVHRALSAEFPGLDTGYKLGNHLYAGQQSQSFPHKR
ncbi:hypothetical protein HAX54_023683, partial [Datura stramonium]|nr:hypothetical protein [Datura stramonium]